MRQDSTKRRIGAARRRGLVFAVLSVTAVLGLLAVLAASMLPELLLAPVAGELANRDAPPTTGPDSVESAQQPRVLVFYDPSRASECIECQLHALRFAYYAFQFRQAGAEVLGVVGGLHEGSASLDPGLELPWATVYDLSGRLAEFYGVERQRNPNPTLVVLDGEGRVRYRAQPRGVDDRIEGEVLTAIAAAVRQQADDATVARANPR